MLKRRQILVIRTGCAIVPKSQSMPTTTPYRIRIRIIEMHIQQSLIRTVKANPLLRERAQRIVIL